MKYIALIIGLSLLAGCDHAPSQSTLIELGKDIRYFKDQRGNCFAAVKSNNYKYGDVLSISWVPCERTGL